MVDVVRHVRPQDIVKASITMRWMDASEVYHSHGVEPYAALMQSVESSPRAWAMFLDGQIMAVLGVRPWAKGIGCPWLLGTEAIDDAPLQFLRTCRKFQHEFLGGWRYLENWVIASYTDAVRWMQWMGFTVEEPQPWGVQQSLFHRCWREM